LSAIFLGADGLVREATATTVDFQDKQDGFTLSLPQGWTFAVPQQPYDRFRYALLSVGFSSELFIILLQYNFPLLQLVATRNSLTLLCIVGSNFSIHFLYHLWKPPVPQCSALRLAVQYSCAVVNRVLTLGLHAVTSPASLM
jgi:hypothetical protein